MNRSALFVVLFAFFVSLDSRAAQVRALLLKLEGPKGNTSCTGTLIKVAGECRLFTNAHCFERPADTIRFVHAEGASSLPSSASKIFVSPSEKKELTTNLVKIDPRVDLAELSVDKNFFPICRSLDELEDHNRINWDNGSPRLSLLSVGFHGGTAQAAYTGAKNWDGGGKITSMVYSASSGLPGVRRIFRLTALQMLPGMSGGPTVDDHYELMGINRRYVPFQSYTEIIPLEELLRFIDSEGDSESLSATKEGKGVVLSADGNVSFDAGENSGGNGGENSGGNGGENSGGNGNDIPQKILSEGPLAFLREPDEGIIVDGKRLLALGKFQIDGGDDYRSIPHHLPAVYLDDPKFLADRSKLMERLSGEFEYFLTSQNESMEKILRLKNGKWEVFRETPMRTDVRVESNGPQFTLSFLQDPKKYFDTPKFPTKEQTALYKDLHLSGTVSQDGSRLTIRGQSGEELVCENRNYFKLICVGEREEISLSLNNYNESLSYRHALLTEVTIRGKREEAIIYRYGKTMKFR